MAKTNMMMYKVETLFGKTDSKSFRLSYWGASESDLPSFLQLKTTDQLIRGASFVKFIFFSLRPNVPFFFLVTFVLFMD